MRRIIIKETDNTTSKVQQVSSTTNVVYIPGFAGVGAEAEVGVPELITSVADFKVRFGGSGKNNPPMFAIKQTYPCCELSSESKSQIGFPKKAIPGYFVPLIDEQASPGPGIVTEDNTSYDLTWFTSGTVDPSYIYALGLLSQGLAVVYERMNDITEFKFEHDAIKNDTIELNEGKAYSGIVSDKAYQEWINVTAEGSTYPADIIAAATEAKTAYDTMLASYDVNVTKAYTYFHDRAFNGVIENIYDETTGEIKTYGSAILNKNEYDVKFITSGGYPAFEYQYSGEQYDNLVELMLNTAAPQESESTWGRGDCVVVIDHTDNPHRPLEGKASVYQSSVYPTDHDFTKGTYGTMFTPWCNCDNGYCMPASYVYLHTFANMVKSNPSWMSTAGVGRGVASCVESLNTDILLTNRIAESYQYGYKSTETNLQCLNAITYVKNYGFTIWGNRTCEQFKAGSTGFATSFLNVRNLISEVKKDIFAHAKQLMFEVNNDLLWSKFEDAITPLLDSMVTGYGLKTYTVVKVESTDKTKLSAQVVLYPTYCVESVSVNIDLQDDEVIVAES